MRWPSIKDSSLSTFNPESVLVDPFFSTSPPPPFEPNSQKIFGSSACKRSVYHASTSKNRKEKSEKKIETDGAGGQSWCLFDAWVGITGEKAFLAGFWDRFEFEAPMVFFSFFFLKMVGGRRRGKKNLFSSITLVA